MSSEGFESGLVYLGNGMFKAYNELMAEECDKYFDNGKAYIMISPELSDSKTRTSIQNKSLHLYLNKLANVLNDAGIDLRAVQNAFKEGFSVSCSKDNLKETVWRPIQNAIFKTSSTKKLSTKQISEVYENVNRFTCERFGVGVPWPDRFSQSMEDL